MKELSFVMEGVRKNRFFRFCRYEQIKIFLCGQKMKEKYESIKPHRSYFFQVIGEKCIHQISLQLVTRITRSDYWAVIALHFRSPRRRFESLQFFQNDNEISLQLDEFDELYRITIA